MMPSNALWVSLPIPTLMLDGSDRIVQSNPAAESFLNVSARALEGAPIWTKLICDASLHDAYARARVTRSGRRYASVQVEAWQDNHDRPIAHGAAHFLMPRREKE